MGGEFKGGDVTSVSFILTPLSEQDQDIELQIEQIFFGKGIPVGVRDEERVPGEFSISQNYPNPFNLSTTIEFGLPEQSEVKISLFDILGREVIVLADQEYKKGMHRLQVNGHRLASGVYFYRMEAGGRVFTETMHVLR